MSLNSLKIAGLVLLIVALFNTALNADAPQQQNPTSRQSIASAYTQTVALPNTIPSFDGQPMHLSAPMRNSESRPSFKRMLGGMLAAFFGHRPGSASLSSPQATVENIIRNAEAMRVPSKSTSTRNE